MPRDLIPDPDNPRKHGRAQIRAIARSIEAFGFNAPILVDKNNKIVAGHGRYEAAMLVGFDRVPVILLDHLTQTQARAWPGRARNGSLLISRLDFPVGSNSIPVIR